MCTGFGRFQLCVVVQRRVAYAYYGVFGPRVIHLFPNNMDLKGPVCIREQGGPRCNFLLFFQDSALVSFGVPHLGSDGARLVFDHPPSLPKSQALVYGQRKWTFL